MKNSAILQWDCKIAELFNVVKAVLKYVVETQSESLQCGHCNNTLQLTENYIRVVLTHAKYD